MVSAGDFRNGVTLEIEGQVMQIMEFQQAFKTRNSIYHCKPLNVYQ